MTVAGSAYDPDGDDILRVELSLDRVEWEVATGSGSWSYLADTEEYGEGDHTVYVRAFDGEDYSDVVSLDFSIGDPDGDDDDDDSPGFGVALLLLAVGLVMIMVLSTGRHGKRSR